MRTAASAACPASRDPIETPTLSAVLTQASPSVSWEGATVTWMMLLPLVRVGAIASPVKRARTDSTTRFGARTKVEVPMASAAVPVMNCFHSGHPQVRAP